MGKEQELRQILTRHVNPLEWLDEIVPEIVQLFQASLPELPLLSDRPIIVCLCGSTRFKEAFTKAQLEETLAGKIVLTIGCNMKTDTEIFGHLSVKEFNEIKRKLDELHKRKIDLADEILVLNVGGYIGDSTKSEIRHAIKHSKKIRYLEPNWSYPELIEPA